MLGKLPPDVYEEITNPDFIKLKHGARSTYNEGCRGPLCRMKERAAKRTQRDPAKPYVKAREARAEKEAELQRIIDWLDDVRKLTA